MRSGGGSPLRVPVRGGGPAARPPIGCRWRHLPEGVSGGGSGPRRAGPRRADMTGAARWALLLLYLLQSAPGKGVGRAGGCREPRPDSTHPRARSSAEGETWAEPFRQPSEYETPFPPNTSFFSSED